MTTIFTPEVQAAIKYDAAGLPIIPIRADGSKAPALKSSWIDYKPQSIEREFLGKGIGIVTAGGLVVIDFDDPELYPEFILAAHEAGYKNLLDKLPAVRTGGGGAHLYAQTDSSISSMKLARRKIGVEKNGRPKLKTTIEVKAGNAYVVAPGSPADCHPSRREYELEQGDLTQIPSINSEELEGLLDIARSFNEYIEPAREDVVPNPPGRPPRDGRPGDQYNETASWEEILEPAGWKKGPRRGDKKTWIRPGGNRPSAVTGFSKERDLLHVFSTSAQPFEADTAYEKFTAYSILHHNRDFKAAAKAVGSGNNARQPSNTTAESSSHSRSQPEDFRVDASGVWYLQAPKRNSENVDDDWIWVCSELRIVAYVRDDKSESWGRLLEFPDPSGHNHRWCLPAAMLAGSGEALRSELLSKGLKIAPGKRGRELLNQFLMMHDPNKLATCVSKTGWYKGVFVMPNQIIEKEIGG